MTTTNDTNWSNRPEPSSLPPAQTLDGAKRAASILQQPPVTLAEHELQSVYLDFGAGRALAVDTAGCFSMVSLERDGRASVVLTRDETQALFRFWLPICGELIMRRISEGITERLAEREREEQAQAEVGTLLEERRQKRRVKTLPLELMQAPNCEGSTLTHPPRIVRDAEGFQRLELKGNDGWEDEGVVEEVTRLERHGLVLVATQNQVFLMTARDFDHPIE